jgi:hypothetical protein
MNDIQNFSSRERGLLSVASQHKGSVAFFQETVVPHLEACLVKAWKKNADEEDIWEYIQNAKWNTFVKMDSAKLGIFTKLEPYTNKKGETKPAHFTENGTYIGSTKQLGDKPVSYMGNFKITKEHFEVWIPENPKRASDFFRPKELVEESHCSFFCRSGACDGVCEVEVEGEEAYIARFHKSDVLQGLVEKCERVKKCSTCDEMRKEEAPKPKKKRPTVAKKPVVGDE